MLDLICDLIAEEKKGFMEELFKVKD